MILEEGKYYLYRHIRLDKNEVFYIGIGKKAKKGRKFQYKRALDVKLRSELWKRIYNKCNKGIKIEILLESDDHKFIKEKEIEFISLYGRINKNNGTLCNFTDGGDTRAEINITPEARKRRSDIAKKRRPSDKFFEAAREKSKVKVYQYDLNGNFIREWDSITEAAKELGAFTTNISKCCKYPTVVLSVKGYIWRYTKSSKIEHVKNNKKRKIYKYSINKELLDIYENVEIAALHENFGTHTIENNARKNICKCDFNYFLSYDDPDKIKNSLINFKNKRVYFKKEKPIKIKKERVFSKEFLSNVGKKQKVKVIKSNEIISIYESIKECAKDLKVSICTVSNSLNKNQIIKKLNVKIEKYED